MYSKLTREIRDSIGNSQLPSEFLVDLAADFGEAVETVNQRLTDVVKILSDGYRDEAIDLAEQAPPLLDLVGQLDFPERDQWNELLDQSDLERSPDLELDSAEQLEMAYDERSALEPLLKKHRLLALAQAPLSARILILRKLCKKDPTNPIWIDDSRMLQQARLSQIKTEFQIAKTKKDTGKLSALTQELSQPWDVPIPKQLQGDVAGVSSNLAKKEAKVKLNEIASQLNNCLVEYDAETGKELRKHWNELNRIAELTPDDEVYRLACEPLAWLKEVDEESSQDKKFHSAVSTLEKSVDQQYPIDRLDKAIYAAQKFERELPETLVHRVNSYRDGLESNRRRKNWLIIVGSLAALIICVVAISVFINQRSKQNAIVDAQQQMKNLLDENAFQSGEQFFDGLAEFIRKDAEVIRLNNQLLTAKENEISRSAKFFELIKLVDLEGRLELNIDDYLDEAEKIATTAEEKSRVEALENQLLSERQIRQNRRNETFKQQLRPLQEELVKSISEDINNDSIGNLEGLISKIEKLVWNASERVDGKAGISNLAVKNAANLIEAAKNRKREIEMASQSIAALALIKDQVERPGEYSEVLTRFASKYPDNRNSLGFRKTATEVVFWTGLKEWQDFARSIDFENIDGLPAAEAKALIQKLKSVMAIDVGIPTEVISSLEKSLEARSKAPVDDGKNRGLLKSWFEQSQYEELEIICNQSDDQDDYLYLAVPFEADDETFKFFIENSKTQGGRVGSKLYSSQLAPHCVVSGRIIKAIDSNEAKTVYELTIRLITETLGEGLGADSKGCLDPLVQCEYLNQILLFTMLMSPELRDFAEEQQRELQTKKLTGNDWKAMNEENNDKRKVAKKYLGKVQDDIDKFMSESESSEKDLVDFSKLKSIPDYKIAGLLYKTKTKWVIDPLIQLEEQAPLFCLKPDAGGSSKLVSIGFFDLNNDEIAENEALQAGRPVYTYTGKR
ncbi:hypothetical protein N9B05_02610 [Mariniblastus sp.]|nr:hypothetical protein [Mariniblastus sp.]